MPLKSWELKELIFLCGSKLKFNEPLSIARTKLDYRNEEEASSQQQNRVTGYCNGDGDIM